jgi:hypothetical protein
MEESKWVSVGPTIIKNSASEYLREAIDSLVIFFIAARYEPSRACFLNPHPVLHPIYSFTFLHRSRRSNFPSDQVLPPWLQLQAATTGSLSAGLQAALDPLFHPHIHGGWGLEAAVVLGRWVSTTVGNWERTKATLKGAEVGIEGVAAG